jgi:dGTPase
VLGGSVVASKFKTIECQIMDLADDIAYSTYDLEDAFKAGLLTPIELLTARTTLLDKVVDGVNRGANGEYGPVTIDDVQGVIAFVLDEYLQDSKTADLLSSGAQITQDRFIEFLHRRYSALSELASNGYARTQFTSTLVGKCIDGVKFEENTKFPCLSKVYLESDVRRQVEVLKRFAYVSLIMSPRLKLAEYRGEEIVKNLFGALSTSTGYRLMPTDFCQWYEHFDGNMAEQKRVVCDFIAGMTDRYAVEFHARLRSDNPETIFKPI